MTSIDEDGPDMEGDFDDSNVDSPDDSDNTSGNHIYKPGDSDSIDEGEYLDPLVNDKTGDNFANNNEKTMQDFVRDSPAQAWLVLDKLLKAIVLGSFIPSAAETKVGGELLGGALTAANGYFEAAEAVEVGVGLGLVTGPIAVSLGVTTMAVAAAGGSATEAIENVSVFLDKYSVAGYVAGKLAELPENKCHSVASDLENIGKLSGIDPSKSKPADVAGVMGVIFNLRKRASEGMPAEKEGKK